MCGSAQGPDRAARCAVLLIALGGGASGALAGTCPAQDSIAVDVSRADTTAFTYRCRGWGQTFLAVDTLIRSISVWVPPLGPPQYNVSSLFITEAVGDTPEVDHLVYAGPPVSRPYTDPVQPTEFRFDLDPPVALPHTGAFFFDVQADYYSAFPMLASNANPYSEGKGWKTSPVFDCSQPGAPWDDIPHPDLVFKIVFCSHDVTTTSAGAGGAVEPGPNPTRGRFSIGTTWMRGAEAELAIYDLNGRRVAVVRGPAGSRLEWNGSGQPVGIYFYRLREGSNVSTGRVAVVR